jgi:rSAM/selenodomain-associated transferase 1
MLDKPITLLFIKAPIAGQVKSRLAADIGNDAALELHKRMALDTIDAVGKLATPFRVYFFPPDAGSLMRTWLGNEQDCLPQEGNDLGRRMEQAFTQVFQEGYDRAVLIGGDIAELSTPIIDEAFRSLTTHGAVLGPAADGGYYLIGFTAKTFQPDLFHDITWSTGTVWNETLGKFKRSGQRVHLLPKLHDIDTKDDLCLFFTQHQNGPASSSRTLTYLTEQEGRFFRP